jgi:hypothetical protein
LVGNMFSQIILPIISEKTNYKMFKTNEKNLICISQ